MANTASSNIGPDGILQILPTLKDTSNPGLYVNTKIGLDKNRFNISFGKGSHLPLSIKEDGRLQFYNTVGSEVTYNSGGAKGRTVRADMYADDGIWNNKTDYSWQNNPKGFLFTDKGIMNGEFTAIIRPHHALGSHQSCAWKLAGRDEDDKRSIFEICAADQQHKQPYAHFDFLHFPYIANPVKLIGSSHGALTPEQWYGTKSIRKVSPDKKSTIYYLFEDPQPVKPDGSFANNWKLIAMSIDKGCKEYKNVISTWRSQKDLLRVDGFASIDIIAMNARAVDITAKPVIPLPAKMDIPRKGEMISFSREHNIENPWDAINEP